MFPDWRSEKKRQVRSACSRKSGAKVYIAELEGKVVGFITYYLNESTGIAEIGNNTVEPQYQGLGIGTAMCRFVLGRMKEAGMKCARVTTGGDPSHAPARRAYEKAGFKRSVPIVCYYQKL